MKKLLTAIITLCFISALFLSSPCLAGMDHQVQWKVSADLGLNILKSTTDSESIYGKIGVNFRQSSVGLSLKNDLYREKVEELLMQYDKNTEMQLDIYRKVHFYFLNASDTRSYALGIDEVDLGAGLGIERDKFKLQTGFFIKDKEFTREYFSITQGGFSYPLNEIFSLTEEAKYQVNTDKADDYRIYSDTAIVSKAMWIMSLAAGYKIIYENLADNRTTERIYCNLRLSY